MPLPIYSGFEQALSWKGPRDLPTWISFPLLSHKLSQTEQIK